MSKYRVSKMSKKSATWHRHGKHRSVLMEIRAMTKRIKREIEMFGSLRELFSRRRGR